LLLWALWRVELALWPAQVSWNVLADVFASAKRYPYVQQRDWLEASHRIPLILEQLGGMGADLIALQEVEPHR
jgi:mRNA deadenylase 3'-5' endonuclease subunit Ccr4